MHLYEQPIHSFPQQMETIQYVVKHTVCVYARVHDHRECIVSTFSTFYRIDYLQFVIWHSFVEQVICILLGVKNNSETIRGMQQANGSAQSAIAIWKKNDCHSLGAFDEDLK